MKKSTLINIFLVVFIIAGYFGISHFGTKWSEEASKSIVIQDKILHVPLQEWSGTQVTLNNYFKNPMGKPLLVNFWATWCTACKEEEKNLDELFVDYGDDTVQMLGVASFESEKKQQDTDIVHKVNENSYSKVLDRSGDVARFFDVEMIPQTFLIDGSGKVIHHVDGVLNASKLNTLKVRLSALQKERKEQIPVLSSIPDFQMQSSEGQTFRQTNLDQKIWVANFIFTSCQSVCPVLTEKLKKVSQQFSKDPRIDFVSFSVDPETDTPAKLKAYKKKHGIDEKRWHFLTGSKNDIQQLMVDGFKLGTHEQPMFHTEAFVLVDAKRQVRGYYSADSTDALKKLQIDIQKLLAH